MSDDELKDKIFIELHNLCGLCSHCGKRACHGRASGSVLPEKLPRNDVILAIERAFKKA
jgi:hypothetical protein